MTDTNDEDRDELGRPSQLFLVRVWVGEGSGARSRWYGRVQHVVTGEVHDFQGGAELAAALLSMVPGTVAPENGTLPAPGAQGDPQTTLRHAQSAMSRAHVRKETPQC